MVSYTRSSCATFESELASGYIIGRNVVLLDGDVGHWDLCVPWFESCVVFMSLAGQMCILLTCHV